MMIMDDLEFCVARLKQVSGIPPVLTDEIYGRAVARGLINGTDILTIRDLIALVKGHKPDFRDEPALHALLICMFKALNEKRLCLRLDEERLAGMLDLFAGNTPAAGASEILDRLDCLAWEELIGEHENEYKPLLHIQGEAGRYLYFQRHFKYERAVKKQLEARLEPSGVPEPTPDLKDMRDCLEAVLSRRPIQLKGQPLELNSEQKTAMALALLKNLVLVSGGPGTGKTSIVVSLLRVLVRNPISVPVDRIRLAAPTGRAANRMLESVRTQLGSIKGYEQLPENDPDKQLRLVKADTIHRLLRFSPSRKTFTYHAANPLPADVVIVDEVSMVDVRLMTSLLRAIPGKATIILLGDKNQLPAVEAGAVLADLIPQEAEPIFSKDTAFKIAGMMDLKKPLKSSTKEARLKDRIVLLNQSYRNEKSIEAAADKVNQGQADEVLEILKPLSVRFHKDTPVPVAHIEWPVPMGTGPDRKCPGGQGASRIDTTEMGLTEWRLVVEAWARHQYLEPNQTGDTYSALLGQVSGELDHDNPHEKKLRDLMSRVFAALEQARVLSPFRRGPQGCETINRWICEFLRREFDGQAWGPFFSGMPLMITRNDHVRQLYNGDVGIILKGRRGNHRAVFPKLLEDHTGYVSFPVDSLPNAEPAFAITVHKSQGAEYGQVLLALPPAPPEKAGRSSTERGVAGSEYSEDESAIHQRLLTREIVYTALTRAKHLAVICGSEEVVRRSTTRRVEHESGIKLW